MVVVPVSEAPVETTEMRIEQTMIKEPDLVAKFEPSKPDQDKQEHLEMSKEAREGLKGFSKEIAERPLKSGRNNKGRKANTARVSA